MITTKAIRVLLTHKNENIKDQVYMRGSFQDNLDFYNNLQVTFGQQLFLQHYIDNQWHTRLSRSPGHHQEVNS